MFDFHIHSNVSFDSESTPRSILSAAEQGSLREICFTDHYDFNDDPQKRHDFFSISDYRAAYDGLTSDTVSLRRGVEFGLTPWNQKELKDLSHSYPFDFVLGSVHYLGGYDPYFEEFWIYNGNEKAFEKYLLQTLTCVKAHTDFDVLAHLTYVCKSRYNPTRKPLSYHDYSDLCDEILKTLVQKGKGLEINTGGVDCVGDFLPSATFLKRFRELGGEIVTVGSDAHTPHRVGQYSCRAIALAREIFGHVCTFSQRKPIFHKL